ncbi:MAG: glycosyltransferase [Candidatus Omnitrophota bacterium]
MKVSIIIAVKAPNPYLEECVAKCFKLTHQDFEIIILPDQVFSHADARVRIFATGPCLPAAKRDSGAEHAQGEILAFLDDDAYPTETWLDRALKNFQDSDVAAVGGPAITPPTEDFWRQASGLVYESLVVSGNFRYRYLKGKKQLVDDFPSCNLLVRKEIFTALGGFQTNFWPGEDTILCLEITKKLKKKIVYDPEVLVFHHRRPLFFQHLKQIMRYAQHRGYFVKHFPQTSLRWQYFVPSAFVLWLFLGFLALWATPLGPVYGIFVLIYLALVLAAAFQRRAVKLTLAVATGIVLTHFWYGIFFLTGLLQPKLKEEA